MICSAQSSLLADARWATSLDSAGSNGLKYSMASAMGRCSEAVAEGEGG